MTDINQVGRQLARYVKLPRLVVHPRKGAVATMTNL